MFLINSHAKLIFLELIYSTSYCLCFKLALVYIYNKLTKCYIIYALKGSLHVTRAKFYVKFVIID